MEKKHTPLCLHFCISSLAFLEIEIAFPLEVGQKKVVHFKRGGDMEIESYNCDCGEVSRSCLLTSVFVNPSQYHVLGAYGVTKIKNLTEDLFRRQLYRPEGNNVYCSAQATLRKLS